MVVVNLPSAQAGHERFTVAEPPLVNVPAAQSLHAVQEAALAVVLNVPVAQAGHVRSVVAEPPLV